MATISLLRSTKPIAVYDVIWPLNRVAWFEVASTVAWLLWKQLVGWLIVYLIGSLSSASVSTAVVLWCNRLSHSLYRWLQDHRELGAKWNWNKIIIYFGEIITFMCDMTLSYGFSLGSDGTSESFIYTFIDWAAAAVTDYGRANVVNLLHCPASLPQRCGGPTRKILSHSTHWYTDIFSSKAVHVISTMSNHQSFNNNGSPTAKRVTNQMRDGSGILGIGADVWLRQRVAYSATVAISLAAAWVAGKLGLAAFWVVVVVAVLMTFGSTHSMNVPRRRSAGLWNDLWSAAIAVFDCRPAMLSTDRAEVTWFTASLIGSRPDVQPSWVQQL